MPLAVVRSQAAEVAPIRTHHVNLIFSRCRRGTGIEGDVAAIRRPRGRLAAVRGQAAYSPGDPVPTAARHRLPYPRRQRRISRIDDIRHHQQRIG